MTVFGENNQFDQAIHRRSPSRLKVHEKLKSAATAFQSHVSMSMAILFPTPWQVVQISPSWEYPEPRHGLHRYSPFVSRWALQALTRRR